MKEKSRNISRSTVSRSIKKNMQFLRKATGKSDAEIEEELKAEFIPEKILAIRMAGPYYATLLLQRTKLNFTHAELAEYYECSTKTIQRHLKKAREFIEMTYPIAKNAVLNGEVDKIERYIKELEDDYFLLLKDR